MLRRSASVTLLVLLVCAAAVASNTPAANTHAAVKAYVEAAAKMVAAKGPDCAALKSSDWMAGDYYIFVVGPDDRTLCHPNPQLIGKPVSEIIDPNGKKVGEALVAAAKSAAGHGWVDYVWARPGQKTPEPKSSYVVLVKGPDGKNYVVGAGGYNLK